METSCLELLTLLWKGFLAQGPQKETGALLGACERVEGAKYRALSLPPELKGAPLRLPLQPINAGLQDCYFGLGILPSGTQD